MKKFFLFILIIIIFVIVWLFIPSSACNLQKNKKIIHTTSTPIVKALLKYIDKKGSLENVDNLIEFPFRYIIDDDNKEYKIQGMNMKSGDYRLSVTYKSTTCNYYIDTMNIDLDNGLYPVGYLMPKCSQLCHSIWGPW